MVTENRLILPLCEVGTGDIQVAGGKGANLGELIRAGFNVPPGFCLTVAAFDRFISACRDREEIFSLLDGTTADHMDSVRKAGQKVRMILQDTPVPTEIRNLFIQFWKDSGMDCSYAVRSSATAEDLPEASFAGQQDTYLNIMGEKDLLVAIRRCWLSLYTDRAIIYRNRNKFSHREVRLSVIIQKMITPESSGVLFTADPLTGHRHKIRIDGGYGLGEAIVSGYVTPDVYCVDKRTSSITERRISSKKIVIYPESDGGIRKEEISPELAEKPVLTDKEIIELSHMCTRIERHFGTPQDIEWAVAGGRIHILQSRPITSLYPLDGLESHDEGLHVFFSMGHQQSMTRAISPLGISTLMEMIPFGKGAKGLNDSLIRIGSGRIFVDLTTPMRRKLTRKAMLSLIGQLDPLGPEAIRQVLKNKDIRKSRIEKITLSHIKFLLPILGRILHALWFADHRGFVDRTNRLIDSFLSDARDRMEESPEGEEGLKNILKIMSETFPFIMNWAPEAAAGVTSARLLTKLAGSRISYYELQSLTSGIRGNVVNQMNMTIGDLADLARHSPEIVRTLKNPGNEKKNWLDHMEENGKGKPFMLAWRDFLNRYGARGSCEIDISMARWYEDPEPVLRVISQYLQREAGHHRANEKRLILEREIAIGKLLQNSGQGIAGPLRRGIIKRLYYVMTEVGGMREHHKFLMIRMLSIVKEELKKRAAVLVDKKKLTEEGEIWLLTWPELSALFAEDKSIAPEIIEKRRADLKRYQKLNPPLIITSDGEIPTVQYSLDDVPEGALAGFPVSSGIAEGIVHVIHDPHKESLAPGEILVARFTDPGWTPLFINAGGLILEVGGSLTHGSVVAREYGIPAIVGIRNATTILKTGQPVRIDGNRGIIEML